MSDHPLFHIALSADEAARAVPCPFCGTKSLEHYTPTGSGWIQCRRCGAQGPGGRNPTEWLELWNQRPTRELPRWVCNHSGCLTENTGHFVTCFRCGVRPAPWGQRV